MAVLTRTENPIRWQEITHQQRTAPRWTHNGHILLILLVVTIVVGVPLTMVNRIDAQTRELALYLIWIIHAVTAVRCITAGANAISREHVGQTWDALVLTGVSARRILLGKWRAALYRVRWWALAFGVIRLAMLPVFMLAFVHRIAWWRIGRYVTSGSYNVSSSNYYLSQYEMEWFPAAAVVAVVMTVVLTLLEVLACTALGLAFSAVTKRGTTATAAAFIVRFTPVALFAAFTRYEVGMNSFRWYRFSPFALADGGTAPLYQLVLPLMSWTRGRHIEALPGLGMALGLVLILLIVSLVVAFIAIRRTGALPHPKQALAEA
ncbi:MAG: hypothetical protein IT324_28265 [Anaerolineae bacterium]|nr:hypothetical protein [Anaerolineae bacterium]